MPRDNIALDSQRYASEQQPLVQRAQEGYTQSIQGFGQSIGQAGAIYRERQKLAMDQEITASQLATDQVRRNSALEELDWAQKLHATDMLGYQKDVAKAQRDLAVAQAQKAQDALGGPGPKGLSEWESEYIAKQGMIYDVGERKYRHMTSEESADYKANTPSGLLEKRLASEEARTSESTTRLIKTQEGLDTRAALRERGQETRAARTAAIQQQNADRQMEHSRIQMQLAAIKEESVNLVEQHRIDSMEEAPTEKDKAAKKAHLKSLRDRIATLATDAKKVQEKIDALGLTAPASATAPDQTAGHAFTLDALLGIQKEEAKK